MPQVDVTEPVSPEQLARDIRFALAQLSAHNAHHEFEHLCRYLTRARICSNVLPATGPVSSGGDRGRDFETFRTHVAEGPLADAAFIGLSASHHIGFACSLQQDGIVGKIKLDVQTMCASTSPPSEVRFFCSCDVTISKRHELKDWARETHTVELEVYDGQAIAELLTGNDVFWIAQRYLPVPSHLVPIAPTAEDWYVELREEWQNDPPEDLNHASFAALTAGTRHATFTEGQKQDIPFWISRLEEFAGNCDSVSLGRRAQYEMAVARLRGLGTLEGHADELRAFFGDLPSPDDTGLLVDSVLLAGYCGGAFLHGATELSCDEISAWRLELCSRIEARLDQPIAVTHKCRLLDLRGYLSFHDWSLPDAEPDAQSAVNWWLELARHLPESPLFPIETLNNLITEFAPLLVSCDGYENLVEQVETVLAERVGNAAAAESSRRRAGVLYKAGARLEAIQQLHKAKVEWFTGDTLEESIQSVELIARIYLQLGMSYAAKYYALAAASLALDAKEPTVNRRAPRSLFIATQADYYHGAWCSFFELLHITMQAHAAFDESPGDLDTHETLESTLHSAAMIRVVAEYYVSHLADPIAELEEKLGFDDAMEAVIEDFRGGVGQMSKRSLLDLMQEQIGAPGFSDLGLKRRARWSALGASWEVVWRNDYETTAMGENLVAVLQILLTEMGGVDLGLVPGKVEIHFEIAEAATPAVTFSPSNTSLLRKVTWPREWLSGIEPQRVELSLIAVVFGLLEELSVLPIDDLRQQLEGVLEASTMSKVLVAQSYIDIYRDMVDPGTFREDLRTTAVAPFRSMHFEPNVAPELAWIDGPGPTFSVEDAEQAAANRYERQDVARHTLKRLVVDDEFTRTVENLRADGWLDWHILLSVVNVAIDYRVRRAGGDNNDPALFQEIASRLLRESETQNMEPIPLEQFSEERLRNFQKIHMMSTFKGFGLEIRQPTPDFEAIEKFLASRYAYWSVDAPHEDPFQPHSN